MDGWNWEHWRSMTNICLRLKDRSLWRANMGETAASLISQVWVFQTSCKTGNVLLSYFWKISIYLLLTSFEVGLSPSLVPNASSQFEFLKPYLPCPEALWATNQRLQVCIWTTSERAKSNQVCIAMIWYVGIPKVGTNISTLVSIWEVADRWPILLSTALPCCHQKQHV